ncbi:hypothetical protein Tco_1019682 [Tanacetum coccineum]|uniref:Uncharacterized protein n=1 Tax=Tanacetum coccineum TaxID=301880 RepID=A0ABQ5FZR9_9ASTR
MTPWQGNRHTTTLILTGKNNDKYQGFQDQWTWAPLKFNGQDERLEALTHEAQLPYIGISYAGDFLGTTPSYTTIRDPSLRLCHRLIACSIAGRSQAPEKVIVTDLFYLRGMDVEILRGLTIIAPELPVIDMAELVKLQICRKIDDTWAWVALGPERQPDATAGTPEVAQDALVIDEGGQADPTPEQAPQQPPPPPAVARTMPQRMARPEEDVQGLRRDIGSLRGLVERSMADQGRFSTWMISCMAQLMEASGQTIKPGSKFSTIVHEYVAESSKDLGSKEISTNIGREFTNLEDLEVLES